MGPTIGAHAQGLAHANRTVAGINVAETTAPAEHPADDRDSGYLHLLKAVVAAMDAAMAAEGIDGDVRDRVVDRVMGTPTPD